MIPTVNEIRVNFVLRPPYTWVRAPKIGERFTLQANAGGAPSRLTGVLVDLAEREDNSLWVEMHVDESQAAVIREHGFEIRDVPGDPRATSA